MKQSHTYTWHLESPLVGARWTRKKWLLCVLVQITTDCYKLCHLDFLYDTRSSRPNSMIWKDHLMHLECKHFSMYPENQSTVFPICLMRQPFCFPKRHMCVRTKRLRNIRMCYCREASRGKPKGSDTLNFTIYTLTGHSGRFTLQICRSKMATFKHQSWDFCEEAHVSERSRMKLRH